MAVAPPEGKQHRPSLHKRVQTANIVWPYELTIDIEKIGQPKVAFGSGEQRQYYPENPGHSRLGVQDAMSKRPGDTPNPCYIPPPFGVNKPISSLGYGIGYLLSKRFPPLKNDETPAPGAYQTLEMYPDRPKLTDTENPLLLQQCTLAFGSHNKVPRFGVEGWFKTPGPGSYHFENCGKCMDLKSLDSFGGRRCIVPTVVTVCRYPEGERCHLCGEEQRFDYYRSKSRMPDPSASPEDKKKRLEFIALCRKCYCKAKNGHFPEFTKKTLVQFGKARHCSFKHEHQGFSNILTKAFPKEIAKLRRKEVTLAQYFPDSCPPEVN